MAKKRIRRPLTKALYAAGYTVLTAAAEMGVKPSHLNNVARAVTRASPAAIRGIERLTGMPASSLLEYWQCDPNDPFDPRYRPKDYTQKADDEQTSECPSDDHRAQTASTDDEN